LFERYSYCPIGIKSTRAYKVSEGRLKGTSLLSCEEEAEKDDVKEEQISGSVGVTVRQCFCSAVSQEIRQNIVFPDCYLILSAVCTLANVI
jgi:hypothetical protein